MSSAANPPDVQTVQRNSGIDGRTLGKLLALFDAACGLEAVWLFGSRATGGFRPTSDIDLVVDVPLEADALTLRQGLQATRWPIVFGSTSSATASPSGSHAVPRWTCLPCWG